MAVHDVSRELRGYHGKWTSGSALKRVVDSAKGAPRGKSVEDHKAAIDQLKPGQARGVNGIKVTHMGDKGYRVTMPGETRTYSSSHDAARAAHGKAHVDPTSKGPSLSGPPPTRHPMAPTAKPALDVKTMTMAQMQEHINKGNLKPNDIIAEMSRREAARVEAENEKRFGPKRGLQTYDKPMGPGRTLGDVNQEHAAAQAALSRLLNMRNGPGPAAIPARQREIQRLEMEARKMGARRVPNGKGFEMPPAPGSRAHAMEKTQSEISGMREDLHGTGYTPASLVDVRRDDIGKQIRSGQSRITVKVPSGSEVSMSLMTAKYLMYGETPGADIQKPGKR